eukprot:scaffold1347_cov350-Pavlova_lutheri.AAC.49
MEEDANKKHGHANCSEKLKRRKTTVETVVKASLQKHLCGDGRQRLRDANQVRVLVSLQPYHLVSIALSGRLKECFDGAEDVATIALPDRTCPSFLLAARALCGRRPKT